MSNFSHTFLAWVKKIEKYFEDNNKRPNDSLPLKKYGKKFHIN